MKCVVGDLLSANHDLKVVVLDTDGKIERLEKGSLFLVWDISYNANRTMCILLSQETGSLSEWDKHDLEKCFTQVIER